MFLDFNPWKIHSLLLTFLNDDIMSTNLWKNCVEWLSSYILIVVLQWNCHLRAKLGSFNQSSSIYGNQLQVISFTWGFLEEALVVHFLFLQSITTYWLYCIMNLSLSLQFYKFYSFQLLIFIWFSPLTSGFLCYKNIWHFNVFF